MRQSDAIATEEGGERERAAAHVDGPLLVLGAAGAGKSGLLARGLADLAAPGTAPERTLIFGARRTTARRLRDHCEAPPRAPPQEARGGGPGALRGRGRLRVAP